MTALIIGPEQEATIARLIAEAEKNRIPFAEIERRTKGQPAVGKRGNPTCVLPMGFAVSFTIEEQPWGWSRHVSISVLKHGRAPTIEACNMIAAAFGFINRVGAAYGFLEDIGDGDKAVNLLEPLDGDMSKVWKERTQ